MKEILIINGSGGVGKDTFVNCMSMYTSVHHTSIADPVKKLAGIAGWRGEKTERDRKFLSDLKVLIDEYNDNNYKTVENTMREFLAGEIDAEVLCIDMREKEQIERAKRDFGAKTLLVTRDAVPQITSNIADAGVYNVKYDYHIENNGTIGDLAKKAAEFVYDLEMKYEKIIYICHPFGGKKRNRKKIEKIIAHYSKEYPNYLFLSGVHAFGYQYNDVSYSQGLGECLWLLNHADHMWVFGDHQKSFGCKREIQFCEMNGIPITYYENAPEDNK